MSDSGPSTGKKTLKRGGTTRGGVITANQTLKRIRAKFWLGTCNNFASGDHQKLQQGASVCSTVVYITWQHEIGQEGTPHLQAFVAHSSPVSLTKMRNAYGNHWHWECAVNAEKALKYCQKEESRVDGYWETGIRPTFDQGNRSDLALEIETIIEGKNHPETKKFAEIHPKGVVQRSKGLTKLWRQLHDVPRNARPVVVILYGMSGTGKSWRAKEFDIAENTYWAFDTKWWDGYLGQRTVVLNDFDPSKTSGWDMSWNTWKRLTDWCPLRREVKGCTVNFAPSYILVTSNSNPQKWWKDERDSSPEEASVWFNREIKEFHIQSKDTNKDSAELKAILQKYKN